MPYSERHVLPRFIAVTLVAAVLPALVIAAPRAVADAVVAPQPIATLTDAGDGVGAVDVPLGPAVVARSGGAYRSKVVRTVAFTMLGVTWEGGSERVGARVRVDGRWGEWKPLALLSDGPDRSAAEGNGRAATDLLWVGRADAAQVQVAGGRPEGLTMTLLDTDRVVATSARPSVGKKHPRRPRPELRSRSAWGADESLRSSSPTYNRTIQQVHVHHTVNSSDYRRADVPGLLRGIYRYHTENLGWSDIGYNFLVDRFGRTWVGRAGGPKRAVRGAHTLGFNSTSTGVAVIGNFEIADPGHRVITALVQLAAWKLHRNGRNPKGRVWVYSHGSDLFPSGQTLRMPTIDGHRDTNETACPGGRLYRHLGLIRKRAAEREARFG